MQNLLQKAYELLKKDERLISNEGELLKNKIQELSYKLDEKLVDLLYSDETIRTKFFKKINEVWLFDSNRFVKFINNKEFLPDSYTSFKNKIGLVDSKEDFIADKNDVVLNRPYKDCILAGGQDTEDAKRDEIFYNEVLASDEIDRLLDPKVFTNFKKYDKDGEHEFTERTKDENGDIKDNLIIKGNNLLVLHSLKKKFAGKVKLIYIDPPYNTGNDGFNYNDKFNHSTWLTFMKNRLEVAKELLSNDGSIWINLDDREIHYCKVLMDEIFGRENFVAMIPRKTRSGKADVPYKISQDYDFIIVYAKKDFLAKRKIERKYYKSDDFPNDERRLNPITTQRTIEERPNSNFTMINPKNGKEYPVNPKRSRAVTKDTFKSYYERNKIIFPGDYKFLSGSQPMLRVFKSEDIDKHGEDFDKTFVSTDFFNSFLNSEGNKEMHEIFGNKIFSYPKPEGLLKTIIEISTEKGDIVLDYHLGSGTTCAVSHKMGRQYIGIEQMDYIENISVERIKKVIQGEVGGVSKDLNWEGGGSFLYMEMAQINEDYKQKIIKLNNKQDLVVLYGEIKNKGFINYKFDVKKFDENLKIFEELPINEIKKTLIDLLEKNDLYLNYSEIHDQNNNNDYIKQNDFFYN